MCFESIIADRRYTYLFEWFVTQKLKMWYYFVLAIQEVYFKIFSCIYLLGVSTYIRFTSLLSSITSIKFVGFSNFYNGPYVKIKLEQWPQRDHCTIQWFAGKNRSLTAHALKFIWKAIQLLALKMISIAFFSFTRCAVSIKLETGKLSISRLQCC